MISLWDENYLFAVNFKIILLIDLKSDKIIKSLTKHKNDVNNIKTIFLPQYRKCLLSQDCEGIIVWGKNN